MASTSSGSDVQALGVRSFVAARVAEIASLTTQINNSGATNQGRVRGFSFQHVSKHMRRRAVSHNPKRLPKRLRFSHMAQLGKASGGLMTKPKRSSNLYKKRKDGDILEFNRRQLGKPFWLESHVWHAKRFHMKSMWGKKLPVAPTSKCFRSLFRAAKNGAIMHDISYLCCLELVGPKTDLLNGLAKILPLDCVRCDTTRESLGHLFSPTDVSYIGTIRYLWVPTPTKCDDDQFKLIIWLHPTSRVHIINLLTTLFDLEETDDSLLPAFPESPNKDEKKHLWKISFNKTWSNSTNSIVLKDISGCINRIRLTGSKTLPILQDILKISQLSLNQEHEVSNSIIARQKEFWENLKRIVDVQNDSVVALNVLDPRVDLPEKRQPVHPVAKPEGGEPPIISPCLSDSPIWDQSVRVEVLRTKTSDSELARIRSENLIPGTSISHRVKANVVPVVLIFRSGASSRAGKASFIGVDMILPMGWLMPFWVSLSFRCVRSYGLEFADYLTFEEDPFLQNMTVSRIFPPDSIPFTEDRLKVAQELKEKYFARPPAKRNNLIKLGCPFPFEIYWHRFLRYVNGEDARIEVMRNTSELVAMSRFLKRRTGFDPTLNDSTLFPVEITLLTGVVEDRACIYLPTSEDLKMLMSGKPSTSRIEQEPLKDVNESQRDELTRTHHKRMALLRKKRKVARRAASSKSFDLESRLEELDSRKESEQFNRKLNDLWLNEDIEDVLSKQKRLVIGFACYAHYSFLQGKSGAMGYVLVKWLKELVKVHEETEIEGGKKNKLKKELYVLVRSCASSLIFNWARMSYPDF